MTLHPVYQASQHWLAAAVEQQNLVVLDRFIAQLRMQRAKHLAEHQDALSRTHKLCRPVSEKGKEARKVAQHHLQVVVRVLRSAVALRQQLALSAQGGARPKNPAQLAETLLMFALRAPRSELRQPRTGTDSWRVFEARKCLLPAHAVVAEQLLAAHADLFPPLPAQLQGQRQGLAALVQQCEHHDFLRAKMALKARILAELSLSDAEQSLLNRCL